MKAKFFLTVSLLALLAFGCQKEMIVPATESATLQSSLEGHFRPASQCGSSAFTTFSDGTSSFGSIEVLNSAEELFILTDMNNGWFLRDVKIFAGNPLDLPKGNTGDIQVEEFPIQINHTTRVDRATYNLSTATLDPCYGITIWAHAVRLNMMGHEIGSVDVWANGSAVLNGYSFQYCGGVCSGLGAQGASNF